MQVETALFFETPEQIYARVFKTLKPRTKLPVIHVNFCSYANANSRVRFNAHSLRVDISDLLKNAPAPIHEALAHILLSKLFASPPEPSALARYRLYISRPEVQRDIECVKRARGRKVFRHSKGQVYDLSAIFDELNCKYFGGTLVKPRLGWSLRRSLVNLGHYDPLHQMIVITSALDNKNAPVLLLKFIVFHEMLHIKLPTENRGVRRCIHTKEFKAAERAFEEYEIAMRELKKFAGA